MIRGEIREIMEEVFCSLMFPIQFEETVGGLALGGGDPICDLLCFVLGFWGSGQYPVHSSSTFAILVIHRALFLCHCEESATGGGRSNLQVLGSRKCAVILSGIASSRQRLD